LLKRTHGGALPIRQVACGRPPKMTCKDIINVKENYKAIALKAVSMINNNDVIFITSATVGYFMAQNLPQDIRVRVVTVLLLPHVFQQNSVCPFREQAR